MPKLNLSNNWVTFTRRTNDPKLAWLENELDIAGIEHRRNGESPHAPILEVLELDLEEAWDILKPVDDIADDDPRFGDAVTWDDVFAAWDDLDEDDEYDDDVDRDWTHEDDDWDLEEEKAEALLEVYGGADA